MMMMMMLTATK